MFKKVAVSMLLGLAVILAGAAEAPDFLKSGGFELGGNCIVVYRPDFSIFASDVPEENASDYNLTVDAGLKAGIFLADCFSLAIRPSFYSMTRHSLNSSLQESMRTDLALNLGLESTYYIPFGSSFALSLGAELGMGLLPGLDYQSLDTKYSDDSLAVQGWVAPKLGGYYLLKDGMALYAALGYKAGYMRLIKDTDGSNHDYGTGYSWTDDIYSHVDFSFGLTFFLPKGARGAETHKASYDDLLDAGLGAK